MAQDRFSTCELSLQELKPESKNQDILVPLSSSVYIPGNLSNVEKVIVDVGTGYYVEKTISAATAFYQNKQHYLQEQLDAIMQTIYSKQDMHSGTVLIRSFISVVLAELQKRIAQNASKLQSK